MVGTVTSPDVRTIEGLLFAVQTQLSGIVLTQAQLDPIMAAILRMEEDVASVLAGAAQQATTLLTAMQANQAAAEAAETTTYQSIIAGQASIRDAILAAITASTAQIEAAILTASANEIAVLSSGINSGQPVRIVLGLPVSMKGTKLMVDFPLVVGNTSWIAIHLTSGPGGAIVPAPAGDVFTVASSDAVNMPASIDVMPSGPLAGTPALKVIAVGVAAGVTATITDSDGDVADAQIFDITAAVVQDVIVLDTADAVTTPTAAAAPAAPVTPPPAAPIAPAGINPAATG